MTPTATVSAPNSSAAWPRSLSPATLPWPPPSTTTPGRELVFAQQVYVYGRSGDILIGLSTSGNSGNVLRALTVARAFGLTTVGFTGSRPCRMDTLCDLLLKVPAEQTHQIQELHLPVYHTLCLMVEQELFGPPADA